MKRLYTLLLILFALNSHTFSQVNSDIKEQKGMDDYELSEIKEEGCRKEIVQDSLNMLYSHLNDSIHKHLHRLVSEDHNMSNPLDTVGDVQIIESTDKQIRILIWERITTQQTKKYVHLVQYYVVPNHTRTFSTYNQHTFGSSEIDFCQASYDDSIRVKKIHHVRHGIYMFETHSATQQRIFGVDISRGVMQNAYIFKKEEQNTPENSVECSNSGIDTALYKIDGQNLTDPNGKTLRFNGSCYEDANDYWARFDNPQIDKIPYITALYYKYTVSGHTTASMSPGDEITLVFDVAYHGDNLPNDTIYTVGIKTTEDEDHFEGKKIDINLPLRSIDNHIFVEAFNFYTLPIDSIKNDVPFTKVINSAGRSYAYAFEKLRYSALVFNLQKTDKSHYEQIRWALKIYETTTDDEDDNTNDKETVSEEYTLDPSHYWGTQIDILIKEEWVGKTIVLTPYVEGYPINEDVSIVTKIRHDRSIDCL